MRQVIDGILCEAYLNLTLSKVHEEPEHTMEAQIILKDTYWFIVQKLIGTKNLDDEICRKSLKEDQSLTKCFVLYMYSMETFLYKALNKACREGD